MSFNKGYELKKFEAHWEKLRIEYAAAGMTKEAIQKMYDYDRQQFNSERTFIERTQEFTAPAYESSEEEASPLMLRYQDAITVTDTYHETKSRFAWIGEIVAPIVEGRSVVLFVGLIILLTTIMTNVANNMATLAIFTPVAYTVGISTGADINMLAVMLCVLMTGAIGLATPPASSTTAYLAGEKEWVPGNSVMKYGVIFCVFNMIIVYVFGFRLGSLLF